MKIKSFREYLTESSDDLARLADLGLVDPFNAAQEHIIRISAPTGWAIEHLPEVGEPDGETDERYFSPEGPDFAEDGGIDWSTFVVGILPDGGVNLYYDSSPQEIPGVHSPEDGFGMSSYLDPVPVPFSQIGPEEWRAVLNNIVENNDWGDSEED